MDNFVRNVKILATMITVGWALMFAGEVEGYFFPVVKNTRIENVVPVSEFEIEIDGQFDKLRSCAFVGIEFRLVHISDYSVAAINFQETSRVRKPGDHSFGPWVVQLKPEQLEDTYAVVYHQCKWRPWKTRTNFWP